MRPRRQAHGRKVWGASAFQHAAAGRDEGGESGASTSAFRVFITENARSYLKLSKYLSSNSARSGTSRCIDVIVSPPDLWSPECPDGLNLVQIYPSAAVTPARNALATRYGVGLFPGRGKIVSANTSRDVVVRRGRISRAIASLMRHKTDSYAGDLLGAHMRVRSGLQGVPVCWGCETPGSAPPPLSPFTPASSGHLRPYRRDTPTLLDTHRHHWKAAHSVARV